MMAPRAVHPTVRKIAPALALAAAILAIYGRGLDGQFVNDDRTYFIENDDLPTLGLANAGTVFLRATNVWGEYLPIRDVAYLLQVAAFDLRPFGFHVVSLLLYGITCALAFLLVRALAEPRESVEGPVSPGATALLVTALFAAHPAHVESVAYVSGQKDLLYGLFGLAALLAFHRAIARPGGRLQWLLAGSALYGLALLSKLFAIVLLALVPVLYLLADRATRPRPRRAAVAWALVNVSVVAWFFARTRSIFPAGATAMVDTVPLLHRLPRAVKIVGALTRNALWPHPLSFGYPFDPSPTPDANLWVGLAVLVACAALAWAFRREPPVLFGIALFLLFLGPVLQLQGSIFNASIFDRYLFLPVLGLAIVAERIGRALLVERLGRPRLHLAAGALVALAWGAVSFAYVPAFASDVAVSRNSYEAFPGWPRPPFELAYALLEAGRTTEARALLASDRSLDRPAWVRPYLEGWAERVDGRPEAALPLLERSAILAERTGNYPFARVQQARALIALGRHAEAEWGLRRAISCPIFQPVETWHAKKLLAEAIRGQAR